MRLLTALFVYWTTQNWRKPLKNNTKEELARAEREFFEILRQIIKTTKDQFRGGATEQEKSQET